MSGLECKNISKSYKDNKVLDNVSLNIEQGKIYGLIGRNGVGKTTLMSIMTGQNPAEMLHIMDSLCGKMQRR